jgi:hypothetical protein
MEEELAFGSVSAPVKIGNTVHRQAGAWTPTIHALLAFLQANHFAYSPEVLGTDEKGREILTFLPGTAATRPWPRQLLEDEGLIQAATMLARYHEIVKNFQLPANVEWRIDKRVLKPGQIIRHGDLGPWNTLWQDGNLTGLIDWDFAEPGEAITDLAQMAYYFVPLRGENGWQEAGFAKRPDLAHRLDILCATYGQFTANEVLVEIKNWLHEELRRVKQLGGKNIEPWVSFLRRGDDNDILHDLVWLDKFFGEIVSGYPSQVKSL